VKLDPFRSLISHNYFRSLDGRRVRLLPLRRHTFPIIRLTRRYLLASRLFINNFGFLHVKIN
jgi:hypothetical protein